MGLRGKHTKKSDQNSKKIFSVLAGLNRVSDPHLFNADPDPAFFLIADPDSGSGIRSGSGCNYLIGSDQRKIARSQF